MADEAPNQFIGTDISKLCSLLGQPRLLTGMYRDILSRHFSDANLIENPELKDLLWNPEESTAILIESTRRWRPETTEIRPAIIIKRNAYQHQRKGIGNRGQGPPVDGEGNTHFSKYLVGSHTLFCIGSSGAQADILSLEVEREIGRFALDIARSLNIHRLDVLQTGEISELEEARENSVVPVTVGFSCEEKWVVRPQAARLTNIRVSFLLD